MILLFLWQILSRMLAVLLQLVTLVFWTSFTILHSVAYGTGLNLTHRGAIDTKLPISQTAIAIDVFYLEIVMKQLCPFLCHFGSFLVTICFGCHIDVT
jgi:hypothetical protein